MHFLNQEWQIVSDVFVSITFKWHLGHSDRLVFEEQGQRHTITYFILEASNAFIYRFKRAPRGMLIKCF